VGMPKRRKEHLRPQSADELVTSWCCFHRMLEAIAGQLARFGYLCEKMQGGAGPWVRILGALKLSHNSGTTKSVHT
jgi:hypothetical protein